MLAVLLVLTLGQSGASTQSNQPVYVAGDGVTVPRLLSEVKPQYTADAMRAKVSGSILLEAVVQVDGTVTDIHVVRSLDPGLDQEAVAALTEWRFSPGLRNGKPVAVRIAAEMVFALDGRIIRGAPVVVLSRTEPNGTRTSFEISEERFRGLPVWDSELVPAPPLSTGDAIAIASAWLNINHARSDDVGYRLVDAGIARIGGRDSQRWYYHVNFALGSLAGGSGREALTVVVLLDGSVVEPRVLTPP
jgi:TonB family protein